MGAGHTYPGATAPFGMVQLSPDVGGARLNGRPLARSWLAHAAIGAGGESAFIMQDRRNRSWANALAERP